MVLVMFLGILIGLPYLIKQQARAWLEDNGGDRVGIKTNGKLSVKDINVQHTLLVLVSQSPGWDGDLEQARRKHLTANTRGVNLTGGVRFESVSAAAGRQGRWTSA